MPFTEGKGILRGKIGFADLTWWTGVSAYVYTYIQAARDGQKISLFET